MLLSFPHPRVLSDSRRWYLHLIPELGGKVAPASQGIKPCVVEKQVSQQPECCLYSQLCVLDKLFNLPVIPFLSAYKMGKS